MKKTINKKEYRLLEGLALLSRQSFEKAEQYRDDMLEMLDIDKKSMGSEEEGISDIMYNGITLKKTLKNLEVEVDFSYSANSLKKNE